MDKDVGGGSLRGKGGESEVDSLKKNPTPEKGKGDLTRLTQNEAQLEVGR